MCRVCGKTHTGDVWSPVFEAFQSRFFQRIVVGCGNKGWWKGAGRHIFTWNILSAFQSLLWVSPIAWTSASDLLGFMTSCCPSFCALDVSFPSSCLCLPTQFVSVICFLFLVVESNVLSIYYSYTLSSLPLFSTIFCWQNFIILVYHGIDTQWFYI